MAAVENAIVARKALNRLSVGENLINSFRSMFDVQVRYRSENRLPDQAKGLLGNDFGEFLRIKQEYEFWQGIGKNVI